MSTSNQVRARRFALAGVIVLIVGGMAASIAFFTATPGDDPDIVGYRMAGGIAYPITLEHSARALGFLRLEGGGANVAAAELDAWIGSLWHGRRLAFALGAATLLVAGLCAGAARVVSGGIAK